MVVGFTTTYTISVYHCNSCEFDNRSWRGILDTTLCDKVCQWLAAGRWFSPGIPVSFTHKTDSQETEILLKVALSTITLTLINNNCYIFMINLLLNMFISRFQCSITIKEPNTVVSLTLSRQGRYNNKNNKMMKW